LSAGEVDGALCFNGQSNHVDVPTYGAINFATGNFSLDLWVRRNAGASGVETLIDKRVDVPQIRGYSLFLFNGQIGLQLADGTFANYLSQPTVPTDGLWHHVAVTVNRGNSAGGRFYLDGVQGRSNFQPDKPSWLVTTAAPFRVGARSNLSAAWLQEW
jgi:Concanavalin A-like lectin/glucanases superfamily